MSRVNLKPLCDANGNAHVLIMLGQIISFLVLLLSVRFLENTNP